MLSILVPVDGSEASNRALAYLVKAIHWYRETPEVHLLNVQHPVHGDVAMFVGSGELTDFHRDRGQAELQGARATLDAAGIAYSVHIVVGEPGEVIARFARQSASDQILLGMVRHAALLEVLSEGVVRRVLRLSEIPVVVAK